MQQTLDFPITTKGELNLISKEFSLPKLFRTSLAVDKRFGKGWLFSIEAIFSKNINEIDYTQVNIAPPVAKSVGPDVRNVYSFSGTPTRIVSRYNGDIYLLTNNKDRKGFAYNFTFTLDKAFRNGFAFNANYSYGTSIVLNEGTSSQNVSQWRFMETVNGRNYITLSHSDFDLGHRLNAYVSKKFTYGKTGSPPLFHWCITASRAVRSVMFTEPALLVTGQGQKRMTCSIFQQHPSYRE
jgi:hypothetical protein